MILRWGLWFDWGLDQGLYWGFDWELHWKFGREFTFFMVLQVVFLSVALL